MGETEVAGALAAWEETAARAHGLVRNAPLTTVAQLIAAGDGLAELVRRAYEPGTWTVLGVWDNDEAVPVGAVEGRHSVHGDMPGERAAAKARRNGEFTGFDTSSFYEQGVWATSVTAPDGDTAQELAAAEMMQGDGCICGSPEGRECPEHEEEE